MSAFNSILYIDTAMAGCGVGTYHHGAMMGEFTPMRHGQGEALMPQIEKMMERAGIAFDDLQAIVTTIGPGSFTGLRVGLSSARSLSLALNIPLFGVSTLQAMAWQKPDEEALFVIGETRRDDFFAQAFATEQAGAPSVMNANAIAQYLDSGTHPYLLIGDGAARFLAASGRNDKADLSITSACPETVLKAFISGTDGFTEGAQPLYLRGADVSRSGKVQRVLAS